MPTPRSLLLLLLLQITAIVAHPLTKRRGGGGSHGSGGGGSSGSGLDSTWKKTIAILASVLGVILLLYILFQCCVPGQKMHDWRKKRRGERLAKKRARDEAKDANASASQGQGKAEMRGV